MSETIIYSDINQRFGKNLYGGISKVTNEYAVAQGIKNAVLTQRGEKLFDPRFGTDLYGMLFENIDVEFAKSILKDDINLAIRRCEPRADDIYINIDLDGTDNNEIKVDVGYHMNNSKELFSVNFVIERIR